MGLCKMGEQKIPRYTGYGPLSPQAYKVGLLVLVSGLVS